MRALSFVAALLLLFVVLAGKACADAKQDVAQLDKLIAQIEKILPAGWTVAFEVANDHCGRSRPKLVVQSAEKLPAEYIGSIGQPPAGSDPSPYIVQENVKVEFAFVPYMTHQEYATTRKQNEDLGRRRRQFEKSRLKQEQSRYKGGFTATTYQRQTGDKSPLVREYAFFWLNTEPKPLPTHHYGTLSVETLDLHHMSDISVTIHDAQKDKEFHQIVAELEKIFVPYATTP